VLASIPCDETSCADTFCSLCDKELASSLDGLVDVVALVRAVRKIIVSDIVELVLVEKFGGNNPWAILDYLIDPFAVAESFGTLSGRHHSQTFALVCFVVACDSNDECCVRESLLGLLELSHVAKEWSADSSVSRSWSFDLPKMEEIKHTISVYTNRSANRRWVGLVATGRILELANGRRRHGLNSSLLFFVKLPQRRLTTLATDSLSNVDAGFCRVAWLARIQGMVSGCLEDTIRARALSLRNWASNS
jgi:hypothetical protein